jgi:hypothetical protein
MHPGLHRCRARSAEKKVGGYICRALPEGAATLSGDSQLVRGASRHANVTGLATGLLCWPVATISL